MRHKKLRGEGLIVGRPKREEAEREDQLQGRCKTWCFDTRLARNFEGVHNPKGGIKWEEEKRKERKCQEKEEAMKNSFDLQKKNLTINDENARAAKKVEVKQKNCANLQESEGHGNRFE